MLKGCPTSTRSTGNRRHTRSVLSVGCRAGAAIAVCRCSRQAKVPACTFTQRTGLLCALKVSFSTRLPADTSHRTSLGPTTLSLDFLPQVLRRRRVSLFSPHPESLPFPESAPMQKKGKKKNRLIQQLGYNLPLKGDHSSHEAKIEGIAHGRSHQAGVVGRDTTWRRL